MFLYAYHEIIQPKAGEKTRIDERIEFFKKRSNKAELSATYVIDLPENKCIKNRYKYDPDNPVEDHMVVRYFVNEYREEIIAEMRLWEKDR